MSLAKWHSTFDDWKFCTNCGRLLQEKNSVRQEYSHDKGMAYEPVRIKYCPKAYTGGLGLFQSVYCDTIEERNGTAWPASYRVIKG